jgi:TrmH family RNA methyltransferase
MQPLEVLCLPDDDSTQVLMRSYPDASVHTVEDHVLRAAADAANPQSPLGVFARPASPGLTGDHVVVLVDISDPGNVGTIVRTAAALGWDVAVAGHTADPWSPKALRSGSGAHFSTNIVEVGSVESAFDRDRYVVVATVVSGGVSTIEDPRSVALLIGNESHGLSDHDRSFADIELTIPMPGGTESLNAAVAAALGMWISMDGKSDA